MHFVLFLINTASRCLIQQLRGVQDGDNKEREDSVQTRNKTNLKGIEDSKWIPYVFNF